MRIASILLCLTLVAGGSSRPMQNQTAEKRATMRFGYTILYVHDVRATIAFYENAFGMKQKMIQEGQYAELQSGATVLAFAQNSFVQTLTPVPFEAADPHKAAPPIEIGFVTDEVEPAYTKAVEAGAVAIKKPELKPWGQTVGYVRDLNGFLIEICTPIG